VRWDRPQQLLEHIMSAEAYRLTTIHQNLDEAIRAEMDRRLPDRMRLLRLKKLKLSVKDRLASLMRKRCSRDF
jgi:hypothetical protein